MEVVIVRSLLPSKNPEPVTPPIRRIALAVFSLSAEAPPAELIVIFLVASSNPRVILAPAAKFRVLDVFVIILVDIPSPIVKSWSCGNAALAFVRRESFPKTT